MRLAENTVFETAAADLTTIGTMLTLNTVVPIRIMRFGFVIDAAAPTTGAALLGLITTPLVAGGGTPVTQQGLVIPTATVEGSVYFSVLKEDEDPATGIATGPGNNFFLEELDSNEVPAGYAITIDTDGVPSVGAGTVFLEYTQLTFQNQFNLDEASVHFPVDGGVVPT